MRLLALLLLAACASPSPAFMGVDPVTLQIDGVDHAVYRKDDRAQVIRLGSASGIPSVTLLRDQILAAEQATGCRAKPDPVGFDTTISTLELTC